MCNLLFPLFVYNHLSTPVYTPPTLYRLNELLEFSEDLECDLPKFWDYIAEVLAPPVVGGGLPLADLKQTHDHVLQSGKMGKLVAKTLQKCTTLEVRRMYNHVINHVTPFSHVMIM